MISRCRVSLQVIVTTLKMIDSLDMKPVDCEMIVFQFPSRRDLPVAHQYIIRKD